MGTGGHKITDQGAIYFVKSRMKGDFHVRFRERLGLKCSCLLDPCSVSGKQIKRKKPQ